MQTSKILLALCAAVAVTCSAFAQTTDADQYRQQQAAARDTRDRQPVQPIRRENLPGRNDPCPCGSGKKFKQCHGRNL